MKSYIDRIKSSCKYVTDHANNVIINDDQIDRLATKLVRERDSNNQAHITSWDEHGWHYTKDSKSCGTLTAQYVFVIDSLNFCFWPCPSMEYDTLALGLTKVLENDNHAFDAHRLIKLTADDISSWFPDHKLPLLEERVDRLHELGYGLLSSDFEGLAVNVVKKAEQSCVKLVELLLQYFPGFRDTSLYHGKLIHFYKRAQILAGDIWAAYDRPIDPTHPFYFKDIYELTMFADYRVPQILREYNILQYSQQSTDRSTVLSGENTSLEYRIDNYLEISSNSPEEIEIRAATIISVEKLKECCISKGLNVYAIELDWLLWQQGEACKDKIKPHHRTLSIYY